MTSRRSSCGSNRIVIPTGAPQERSGEPALSEVEWGPAVLPIAPRYIGMMAKLNPGSIVCHKPNPVAADVAGETVLMSLERSRCYGLGEIGSDIWSKLAAPVRVE